MITPNIVFLSLLMLVLVLLLVYIICSDFRPGGDNRTRGVIGKWLTGSIVIFLLSPVFLETTMMSVPVTFSQDRVAQTHPQGCWDWPGRKMVFMEKQPRLTASSSVTPITDNPKAVRFSYQVTAKIADPAKFFTPERQGLDFANWWGGSNETITPDRLVSEIIRGQLYNFNHYHSGELAKLWNPMDTQQSERFKELISQFLQPVLDQNGLTVTDISFDVG